jgi:hypothetical protein
MDNLLVDLNPQPGIDPDEYPPPSPLLLKLHASCAKILHLPERGEKDVHYWEEFKGGTGLSGGGEDSMLLQMAVVVALEKRAALEAWEEDVGLEDLQEHVELEDVQEHVRWEDVQEEVKWHEIDGEPPAPPPSPSEEQFILSECNCRTQHQIPHIYHPSSNNLDKHALHGTMAKPYAQKTSLC